jgi:hypothetical protein
MKHKLILIGGAVASAVVSFTIMWVVLRGIVYLMYLMEAV